MVKENQKNLRKPLELMEIHVSESPPDSGSSFLGWKQSYNYVLLVLILIVSAIVIYKIVN